jgi:hypothetical protein
MEPTDTENTQEMKKKCEIHLQMGRRDEIAAFSFVLKVDGNEKRGGLGRRL